MRNMNYLYGSPVWARIDHQAKFHSQIKNNAPIVSASSVRKNLSGQRLSRGDINVFERWRVTDGKNHPVTIKKLK